MRVDMGSYAAALVTAFLLGLLLWCMWHVFHLFSYIFVTNTSHKKTSSKVISEINMTCFILGGTICMLMFMYYMNRGIFRWFLFLAVICGFFVFEHLLGRHMKSIEKTVAARSRRCLFVIWKMLYRPVCFIARIYGRAWHKISLPIKIKCANIMLKLYDRKKHRNISRMTRRLLRESFDADAK